LPQLSDYLQPVNALMDARNKVQPYTPSFISLGRQSIEICLALHLVTVSPIMGYILMKQQLTFWDYLIR